MTEPGWEWMAERLDRIELEIARGERTARRLAELDEIITLNREAASVANVLGKRLQRRVS